MRGVQDFEENTHYEFDDGVVERIVMHLARLLHEVKKSINKRVVKNAWCESMEDGN